MCLAYVHNCKRDIRRNWRAPIFKQTRFGKKAKPFTMYKFRTLRPVSNDSNELETTLTGRFLRSTNLNELPQIYNILKGDMRIIGPRAWNFKAPEECHDIYKTKPGLISRSFLINPKFRMVEKNDLETQKENCNIEIQYNEGRSFKADVSTLYLTFCKMVLSKEFTPEPSKHYKTTDDTPDQNQNFHI